MLVIAWMGQKTKSHQTSYCCLRLHSQFGSFYFFPKTEWRTCAQKKQPKRNPITIKKLAGTIWTRVALGHIISDSSWDVGTNIKLRQCDVYFSIYVHLWKLYHQVQLNTFLPKPVSFYHASLASIFIYLFRFEFFTDFELEITIISNRQSIIQSKNHGDHGSQHQKQESRAAKLDSPQLSQGKKSFIIVDPINRKIGEILHPLITKTICGKGGGSFWGFGV